MPIVHPLVAESSSAKSLRLKIYEVIRTTRYIKKSDIIFVCGAGTQDKSKKSLRDQFTAYAKNNLKNFKTLFPENALKQNLEGETILYKNLSDFEILIAELSHCILIFPESVGSFCELGLFSASEEIRKKMLVVSDFNYQSDESFLNDGPIQTITRHSKFGKAHQLNYKKPDFEPIIRLIERKSDIKRRSYQPFNTWQEASSFTKLAVIFAIIELSHSNTLESIKFMTKGLYSGLSKNHEVVELCQILIGCGLCQYDNDTELITMNIQSTSIINFTSISTILDLKGKISTFYRENEEFSNYIGIAPKENEVIPLPDGLVEL